MVQTVCKSGAAKKHPCPDCKMCQGCSETRCRRCRSDTRGSGAKKLSMKEQIQLFNRLNPDIDECLMKKPCNRSPGQP